MNTKDKIKKRIFDIYIPIALYGLFAMIMIVFIREKTNYHLDEVTSMVMANNTYDDEILISAQNYYKYDDPAALWNNRTAVREGHRFDFKNVWEKTSSDVHPPLHFLLLNIVSSLFPGKTSKWIGGGINIDTGLLCLFVFRNLIRKLKEDDVLITISSVAFVFSAGILTNVTYLRMYLLTTLFVSLISYVFVSGMEKTGVKWYLSLFLTAVTGTLTHYYFLIFLFFICLAFGVFLIIKHRWKDILFFLGSMIAAGITVWLIFPSILTHSIGGGYRGEEVLSNFKNSDFFEMISENYPLVDSELFGGLFLYVIGACIIAFVVSLIIKKKKPDIRFEEVYKYGMLWFSVIMYYLIVSKITIYVMDRYFFPIYAVLLALFVATLYNSVTLLAGKKIGVAIICVVLAVTTFKDFKGSFYYLYRGTRTLLNEASAHSDSDCVFFYNNGIQITPAMLEVANYNSITFVPFYDMSLIEDVNADTDNGLVVVFSNDCDYEKLIKTIQETWPELGDCYYMGGHSYTESLYFFKKT